MLSTQLLNKIANIYLYYVKKKQKKTELLTLKGTPSGKVFCNSLGKYPSMKSWTQIYNQIIHKPLFTYLYSLYIAVIHDYIFLNALYGIPQMGNLGHIISV